MLGNKLLGNFPRTSYAERVNRTKFWFRHQYTTQTTSLVAQMVKCLSTMQETRVQSLGWEDPLEKEMAIHSSTTAWKIPWTEEPGRLQSMGSQRVGHDWATSRHIHTTQTDYLLPVYVNLLPITKLKQDFSLRYSLKRKKITAKN